VSRGSKTATGEGMAQQGVSACLGRPAIPLQGRPGGLPCTGLAGAVAPHCDPRRPLNTPTLRVEYSSLVAHDETIPVPARQAHELFRHITPKKGMSMTNVEHSSKTPSLRIGFFAVLWNVLRVKGSGAPLSLILGALATILAILAVTAAPALAAGPPEAPMTETPNPIAGTSATFNGVLNPGTAPQAGTYDFLYKKVAKGAGCEGESATPLGVVTGFEKQPVSEPTSLEPDAEYTVCLAASNTATPEEMTVGNAVLFKTLAIAPEVEEQSVLEVAGTSATLRAKINPEGLATTYRFEYDTSEYNSPAAHGETIPVPAGQAGEGTEGVLVQAEPQDLKPHTLYHFRVVAENEAGKQEGADQSFTTQPAGGELVLHDNRAWELVSPPQGDEGSSAAIEPISEGGVLTQTAEDGDALAFGEIGSVEPDPQGTTNYSAVLSTRDPNGGWSAKQISTAHEQSTGISIGHGQEYRFFSSNLSLGLVEPLGTGTGAQEAAGATPLSPGASEKTLYLRADAPLASEPSAQGAFGEAVAEGGYKALVTSKPGYANVPLGTVWGNDLEFDGASSDLSHVIVNSVVPLTADTPEDKPVTKGGLYEWAGGQLQIISVLPNGEQASEVSLVTAESDSSRGTVSSDGSRIVWSGHESEFGEAHLYMRDVATEQTVRLDTPEPGVTPGEGQPERQFENSDGSRVFFKDQAKLTSNSTAGSGGGLADLYMCEIVEEAGGPLSCKLSDLTADPHSGQHAGVVGSIPGGSEDGSFVYYVAEGELTGAANEFGEKAKNREPNLYMSRYNDESGKWETVFIAGLSIEDSRDWGSEENHGEGAGSLEQLTSRVSPSGQYVEFMSDRSLTGYNNRDASSGVPDEEIFLYDAQSNHLVCASCNPTGERPAGVQDVQDEANFYGGLVIDRQRDWPGRWLAANVPGWSAIDLARALYQSRYLSDSGRLFFNSPDQLVPQATNGLADVYEYEPAGVGNCEASSATYSERSEGCVRLISSGASGQESAFLDASASGDDVFFISSAPLAAADTGSALSVFDAHVCSAAAPCPAAAVAPPPCTTADSCRAAPTPQPAIFGAPSSATFSGAGNITPVPAAATTKKTAPKKAGCPRGKRLDRGRCVRGKTKKRAGKAGGKAGKTHNHGRGK
jgi:hypothetical protein